MTDLETMGENDASWSVVSASVRGASHIRNGLPNQDATLYRPLQTPTGAVAAVADGHGGKRYVRSDRGSAFAVEIACDTASEFLELFSSLRGDELLTTAREALISPLVDRWRDRVRSDLKREPLTAEEEQRSGQLHGEDLFLAYGATLLISVVWDDNTLLLQLGDGDLLAVLPSGVVERPVPDDARLVAGETTSLGLPDAVESFRLAELPVAGTDAVELLMLCTDGYGNSFADPDWRHEVGVDLLERARREGVDELGAALPAWLAESASAGGDDVTMALLHRNGEAPVAPSSIAFEPRGATSPPIAAPIAPIAAAPPSPTRQGRMWMGLLAAIVALAIGAGIGWLARGDGTTTEIVAPPESTDPATTDPTAASTTGVPEGSAREVVLIPGGIVSFEPSDPMTATFRSQRVTPDPPKQVTAGSQRWSIEGEDLVWRTADGTRPRAQPEPPLKPAGITYAGGKVWIADAEGLNIAMCDAGQGTCDDFSFPISTPPTTGG